MRLQKTFNSNPKSRSELKMRPNLIPIVNNVYKQVLNNIWLAVRSTSGAGIIYLKPH